MAAATYSRAIPLIVAGSQFMQNLDSAIINTSLPQMAESFGVAPVDLSAGVTAYILAVAAFVPLSGWLTGRLGSRSVFTAAILLFTIASFFCGVTQTFGTFVAARVAQGIGGALMVPVGQAIVLRHTEKRDLVRAMALITWPALLAPVLGPVIGGLITTYWSWRWNFLLNIPLGLPACLLALLYIPNDRNRDTIRLDSLGFGLCSGALVCLIGGLELSSAPGRGLVPPALLLLGAALAWLAVRHLRRAPTPLLALSPLEARTYSMSAVDAGLFIRATLSGTPFLLPLLFQVPFGLSAAQAGSLVLIYFLGNVGIKAVSTPLLRILGFRRLLMLNGLLIALSFVACTFLAPDLPKVLVGLILIVAGATRSLQFTGLNTMAYADVKSSDRISASTLAAMMSQVSMALGVAAGALVLNASRNFRGADTLALGDFHVTFAAFAVVALLAALRFRRLPGDAGAEVSGHGRRRQTPVIG